jgi:hypothetical protein
MRLRIRVLLHALRKPFVPPLKEGRRSADRRITGSAPPQKDKPAGVCGEHHRFLPRTVRDRSGGALAFRRPTAVMRRGLTRLGSGPRFLEPPDPNGRTLSGTSAASTWQSGHAPDGRCPEPPGSRLQAPSGNRTRPTDRLSPVNVPSMGELALCNCNGDRCQGVVARSATGRPQAVMAGLDPAIHVFGSLSP